MQWLVLSYFLSLGTLAYRGEFLTPEGIATIQTKPLTFQTTMGLEVQMFDNHLFIGGSVETWETFDERFLFDPSESLYKFSVGIRWGGLELGYRHKCEHLTIQGFTFQTQGFWDNGDEVYMNFKSSVKIF